MTSDENKVKIIYATESVAKSAAKDIISISLLLAAFWANHIFIGGNIILSLLIGFFTLSVMLKHSANYVRTVNINELPEHLRRPEK